MVVEEQQFRAEAAGGKFGIAPAWLRLFELVPGRLNFTFHVLLTSCHRNHVRVAKCV